MTIVKTYKGYKVPDGSTHFSPAIGMWKDAFYSANIKKFISAEINDNWENHGCNTNLIELPVEQYMPEVRKWCEYNNQNSGTWIKIFYLGKDSRGIHAIQYESDVIEAYAACSFRPIKSEREKVIEWAVNDKDDFIGKRGFTMYEVFGRLFDLGALTIPKEK